MTKHKVDPRGNIRVAPEVHKELGHWSVETGLPLSEIVRELWEHYKAATNGAAPDAAPTIDRGTSARENAFLDVCLKVYRSELRRPLQEMVTSLSATLDMQGELEAMREAAAKRKR